MSSSPVSFGGLESGLDTSAIISAEMAIYEQPLNSLKTEQTSLNTQISDYQTINSQLLSVQQAADALSNPIAYDEAFSATSSNSSVATGSITSGTSAGAVTLAVDQLATGSTQISAGTVASSVDVVATGNLLVGSGSAPLGIASLASGSGLAIGAHTISVTQASAGAAVSSSTPLATSTTITAANDTLNVTVNGTAQSVVLANGTYSSSQLASEINQSSGGTLAASVNPSGVLTVATSQQGSSASLQVTGGSALSTLGISSGSTVYGVDGQITVDGTTTSVSNIAGSGTTSVTLNSGTGGTITAQLSGGLSAGSMTAQNVSVGDGSLSSVVSAINDAHAGVTATALEVGANQYALEVTSENTGLAASSSLDANAFATSSLGVLNTTTAAQNAIVSVGGVGGFQVTSASNAVTGLLPGLTVNVSQVSASPVTVSIQPDGTQIANQVATLVNAANAVLSSISSDTAYNQSTNSAAALNGATSLTELSQKVLSLVGTAIGSSGVGSDGTAGESAGLAITATGTITFNQSAFVTAYDANPTGVQSMFTEGGTFSPSSSTYAGEVSVAGATDQAAPGSYSVSISQSAAQAVDTGSATFAAPTSALGAAESYTVTSGSSSATYAASAGESVANVISGLNSALAASGIGASASLVGTAGAYHVQMSSAAYGASASFSLSASGADQLGLTTSGATYSGADVVGTIDGQPATGVGQTLSLEDQGSPANGLTLQVTTPGITSATSLGTVNYNPGFAQGLANLAAQSSVSPNGQIADTIAGLNSTLENVTQQIALQQELVNTQQATLTTEFTNMEKTLTQLKSESSYLSSAASAPSSSSSSSSSSSGGLSSLSGAGSSGSSGSSTTSGA
jgi:flagellar hook-associated protein 2